MECPALQRCLPSPIYTPREYHHSQRTWQGLQATPVQPSHLISKSKQTRSLQIRKEYCLLCSWQTYLCTLAENKPTIDTSKLVSGFHITEVLYVPISNDRYRYTVFDCLYGIIMDWLVAFFCCTAMDCYPWHTSWFGLLAQINCLPQVLVNSVDDVNFFNITSLIFIIKYWTTSLSIFVCLFVCFLNCDQ